MIRTGQLTFNKRKFLYQATANKLYKIYLKIDLTIVRIIIRLICLYSTEVMLNTPGNMWRHGFSLICICPYKERICDSVHKRENTDMILIQSEKLRLFLRRLGEGVHYDLPYLLWSYVRSLKLFRERWLHQVFHWLWLQQSDLLVHHLWRIQNPVKHLRCNFLQKIL